MYGSASFRLSFFPSTIKDWNNLDNNIREAKSKLIFKKCILNKIRPKKASYFGIRDHNHIRYLTMLRLGLSPLKAHKYRHGFQDIANGLCEVCNTKEDTKHFLLLCRSYTSLRTTLLQKISNILHLDVSTLSRRSLVNILLFGRKDIPDSDNNRILNSVIDFIIKSKRLDIFWGEGGSTSQT